MAAPNPSNATPRSVPSNISALLSSLDVTDSENGLRAEDMDEETLTRLEAALDEGCRILVVYGCGSCTAAEFPSGNHVKIYCEGQGEHWECWRC